MPEILPAEVNRSDPEADHILMSTAVAEREYSSTFSSSRIVVVWCLISTRVSLSSPASQIKTLHVIINFVIGFNSLRQLCRRLPFRWNAIHASNLAYLLKIRPCFLMIVAAGREEQFQSFGFTLAGFPLTLWRTSDDFLLSTCQLPIPPILHVSIFRVCHSTLLRSILAPLLSLCFHR